MENTCLNCIAFDGIRRIASGPLAEVAPKVKEYADVHPLARILVFNAETSEPIEIDCRGSLADVMGRIVPTTIEISPPDDVQISQPAGRGRPKLGVVAREVTLLPRHWEWLGTQPGGASVALRKLVEHARRANSTADRIRQSQNATSRFMTAMAGDLNGYEEASRALFAADRQGFESLLATWPEDIRTHLLCLAENAFQAEGDEGVGHA